MDETKICSNIDKLTSKLNAREGKYIRNIARYMNNGVRREDLWSPYLYQQNFGSPAKGSSGVQTQINVIQLIIDTVCSKISQAISRPRFNSVNGDYDSEQLVKALQNRFDVWLDEQHAYIKSVLAFRDAAICDIGVLQIDPKLGTLNRCAPWKYFLDPAEYDNEAVTQVVKWEKYFPLAKLKDVLTNEELKQELNDDPQRIGRFAEYWDLYNGMKYELFDGKFITDGEDITHYEKYNGLYRRPFVEIFYTRPLKGFSTRSLADDLYPIQRQIDSLVVRMDEATRNAVTAMGFVPDNCGIKVTQLENGYKLYNYTPNPEGAKPEIVTPPAINNQFVDLLKYYIQLAHDEAGINQLSTQGKKPKGIYSGKAMDTLEDIQSDRFNTQLNAFVHFMEEVTRVCIDIMPKKDAIINNPYGDKITWGQAKKERDNYKLQFSSADILSKDPSEKIEQIYVLQQMGKLDEDTATDFLQIPDLEGAYTMASSSDLHCKKIINRAIKNDDLDYNQSVDLEMLQRMTIKQINIMEGRGDKDEYIGRCKKLLEKVISQLQEIQNFNGPPPPPAEKPLSAGALEGSQIKGLTDMLALVNQGIITPDQAIAVAIASYPKVPQEIIQKMFNPGAAAPAPPQEGAVQ